VECPLYYVPARVGGGGDTQTRRRGDTETAIYSLPGIDIGRLDTGKERRSCKCPDHIVGYAIHLTASAVVFLAEAEKALK